MFRTVAGLLIALTGLVLSTGPAIAANSLHENALALSVEADQSPFIGLKWNMSEANAIAGAIEFFTVSDDDDIPGDQDASGFGLQFAYLHYWNPADFSPYSGAEFQLENRSNGEDATDWTIRGFVGVEAFLMSNASVSGDLGLNFGTIRDGGQTVIQTASSAVRFSLYFN